MTRRIREYGKSGQEVCSFFTAISEDFDLRYAKDKSFGDRLNVWKTLLNKYAIPGKKAVDFGCGSGIFSDYLAKKGMQVTGIDGSEGMISLCNTRKEQNNTANVTFRRAEIPYFDWSLISNSDLIISSSVLEYVKPLDATLDLVSNVLGIGGCFIASIPNANAVYRRVLRVTFRIFKKPAYYRYVINQFTIRQFKYVVEKRGFKAENFILYGESNPVSIACRAIGLGPEFCSTLIVGVFKKI